MSPELTAYLKLVASGLIDKFSEADEAARQDRQDEAWDAMNPETRETANMMVKAIFGDWL